MSRESDDRYSEEPVERRGGGPPERRGGWERDEAPDISRRGPDDKDEGSLGSLAQAARLKQLNQARWGLIIVGILQIVTSIVFIALARGQLNDEIRKRGLVVDPAAFELALRFVYIINGAGAVLGVIFIVLGSLVHKYPLPMTITGLILFVLAHLAFIVIEIENLYRGIILKIIIVVVLAKAIQAAAAYEKDKKAEGFSPGYE